MAKASNIVSMESIHTSLMRTLVALNDGKELTPEQMTFFKKAIDAKETWDPNKANDLVNVHDIIALSPELLASMGVSTATLTQEVDFRQLSAMQRALLEQFDVKLEQIAKDLLTKAERGLSPEDLKITGDTKWEHLARELLVKTMSLIEVDRGLKPGTLQNPKQSVQ